MPSYIKRGESLFIPFRNGQSITDSQLKPRMYKSIQNFEKAFPNFEKAFPTHNHGRENIEVVEYAEVKHGYWKREKLVMCEPYYLCSICGKLHDQEYLYCNECGARMDGRSDEG